MFSMAFLVLSSNMGRKNSTTKSMADSAIFDAKSYRHPASAASSLTA
jgi:hypothetical protein